MKTSIRYFAAILFVIIPVLFTSAKNYKGAEYRTKSTFLYGRFEVRMKPAHRSGVISSFFTYHEISNTSEWNEIDIECMGRYDNQVQFNTITPNITNHVRNHASGFNPFEDYHTYAFEWTPFYVAWFIDDVEVYRQTQSHIVTLNKAQKLMMNLWNSDAVDWAGGWNDYSLPAFAYYDWVKYYTYSPGTGNYGSNNDFTLSWTDDFDFFDSNRWAKATHTFNGNMSDFTPDNIVFQDGKMILCLTDANNLGFQDKRKPTVIGAKAFMSGNIEITFSEELDQASAETASNYNITSGSVLTASLSGDKRKVMLTTDSYDPNQLANIIVLNVKDQFGNVVNVAATTIVKLNYIQFPAKINLGGSAQLNYLEDKNWSEINGYGHTSGFDASWASNIPISGTTEDIIYLNDRQNLTKYNVKMPNGNYKITFLFAEKYFDQSGKRVFDIYAENQMIVQNLDIFSEVGKNAAYAVTKNVSINDELLDLIFSPSIDQATISGLIIEAKPTDVGVENQPQKFILNQNFPNPFNPTTEILFTLNDKNFQNSFVNLSVYNTLGQKVAELINQYATKSQYRIIYDGSNVSSGTYFYNLSVLDGNNKQSQTRKMILIK